MPCNSPLAAWRAKSPNDNGRLPVVFQFQLADSSQPVEIPCGRCAGCRLERARSWAIRMVHESKLYRHNHFLTLTYDNASLPFTVQGRPTLQPEHFTLFMKRLRKHFEVKENGGDARGASPRAPPGSPSETRGNGIRYYQCGEYGETTRRPHHHAIVFNLPLTDLKRISTRTRNAHALYTSETIERIWGHGIVAIGAVTFETAAYVAAYVTKKITGPSAEGHYQGRTPEYATMSRRPGIGAGFLTKFLTDVYPSDEVIIRGKPMRPPKYYDRRLELMDSDAWYEVRDARATAEVHHAGPKEKQAREHILRSSPRKRDAT